MPFKRMNLKSYGAWPGDHIRCTVLDFLTLSKIWFMGMALCKSIFAEIAPITATSYTAYRACTSVWRFLTKKSPTDVQTLFFNLQICFAFTAGEGSASKKWLAIPTQYNIFFLSITLEMCYLYLYRTTYSHSHRSLMQKVAFVGVMPQSPQGANHYQWKK